MTKKRGAGGFTCNQIDLFGPAENLKVENGGRRHGSCCGVLLTILLIVTILAYAANELLINGKINAHRVHAYTSIVTDYHGSDMEHILTNQRTGLMFGVYDTTKKTFEKESPDYFTYHAVRKTLIGAESG